MGEERKYKYLVDVCELVDTASVSVDTGCSPGDAPRVRVDFESKNGEAWHIFDRMLNYKDEILFYVASYGWQLLTLDGLNVRHTAGAMDFMVFSLSKFFERDEFVKELKKITSVDDIVKSHVDEPGERGEEGIPSVGVFSDTVDVWECDISRGREHATVIARMTSKTKQFLNLWFCAKPPRKFCYMLNEGSNDIFFLDEVEVEQDLVSFKFSYFGNVLQGENVSLYVPKPTWLNGAEPTITVSKKEEEKMLEHFKAFFKRKRLQ